MSVKVFKTNKADKIELTRAELEKLLNDIYGEGYRDGENHAKNHYWTWASPSLTNDPFYYNYSTSDSTSNSIRPINGTNVAESITLDKVLASCDGTCECDGACNTATTNKIKIETQGEAKNGKADVTAKVSINDSPAETYEVKNSAYTTEDLSKTIQSIFNSMFDPANIIINTNPNNGVKTPTVDDVFTKLAKELNF